ncbi:DNA replication ATP-dependent helicase/nuclease JHS1 isoform X1 [Ipomoea triloba]|uniref:DNA replication ATP-dependent helicase/nuclease JHS1 isoform X1 n=1 Tax=Ipomoea triloba TaxID=35885 RepID=UPI00125D8A17|nr:DNA replication ATP-dependent helicase/nuclease JHS1 isoform X1 [Ipomoea triloba]
MPPRKRTSGGGSKKSSHQNQQQAAAPPPQQQPSQPTKFGIQHFFERHTQNVLSQKSKARLDSRSSGSDTSSAALNDLRIANPSVQRHRNDSISIAENSVNAPDSMTNLRSVGLPNDASIMRSSRDVMESNKMHTNSAAPAPQSASSEPELRNTVVQIRSNSSQRLGKDLSSSSRIVEMENSKNTASLLGSESNNSSQNTPTDNALAVVVGDDDANEAAEVTPEVCKSASVKRFKFSPGMLIKQSQDDGGDEITWRISPVNERLNALSKSEKLPVLADCSRLNLLNFQQCSQKKVKTSPQPSGKVQKWLSSPPPKKAENSLVHPNKTTVTSVNVDQVMDIHAKNGKTNGEKNSAIANSQSPFKTPPSLTYCNDKSGKGSDASEVADLLGSKHNKKALIELLDQVEDVISVESSVSGDNKISSGNDLHVRSDPVLPEARSNLRETSLLFLVLEVSEKHGHLESSGSKCLVKVLRLFNEQSGEERVVQLWDEWLYSVVAPGDTVHVIGEFDDKGTCDVNHEKNFLIVHPDILASGTRVAASFSCSRRAVLDERLKFSEYSAAALIGTLLHQIFQAGLIRESPTKEYLKEHAQVLLHKNLESLYACKVSENEFHKILIEAIPKILNWIHLFRDSEGSKIQNIGLGSEVRDKKIKILEVLDIEEMAWAPKYGLKGMIDVSVQVKVEINNEVTDVIVPLEFKTGKGTSGQAAMEHNAQVMLYTLLMSERYSTMIDYGLLYYLHTDQTQGITVRRSDLIGLLMRRNELANDLLRASTTQQLPPMIQSPNMCKGCRHLNICSVYHKAYGGTTEGSGLGNVFDSLVNHLTTAHAVFLQKWDRLIDLEAKELEFVKKEIWSSHGSETEGSSSCLSPLVLGPSDKLAQKNLCTGNQFIYHFVHQSLPSVGIDQQNTHGSSITNNLECRLRNGDYVILSTEPGRLIIASGVITDTSNSHVSVSFSKRLRLPGSRLRQDLHQQIWRIDKDEFTSSFAIMRFNLTQLFMQNEESIHLRKMIVDLEVPRFDSGCIFSQDPAISYIWSEKTLNGDQRRAILKILTAKDYALILGMPGTGKTSTMVHAVKALLMRGASILLTSYTNSAVDNLLLKLKAQGIDFIRIGRYEAVHEEVREHCLSTTNLCGIEDIKQRLEQIKVVGVTCLGITSPLLANKRFDVCIMDEAGQTTLPVSLGPLMFASKFVLVGDHYQLPPLVQSAEAKENGMAVSLFCRLSEAHPQAISALQSQYRMCKEIMELSNTLIYGNRLRCGSSEVENAKLTYSCSIAGPPWMKEVMNPNKPVIFINTDLLLAFETNDRKSLSNPIEAYIISEVSNKLLNTGISQEDIGIITPYNSQADLIRQAVSTSVEIHTIDKYQGRDKDCILVSFVRSNENPKSSVSTLLGDWHRINVALTRAKKKLIMVGSCATLSKVPLPKLLIETIEQQGGIFSVGKNDIRHCKVGIKRCSQTRSDNGDL